MRYVVKCMYGHELEVADADEMMAFAADDSPPCGECDAPTFAYGIGDADPMAIIEYGERTP